MNFPKKINPILQGQHEKSSTAPQAQMTRPESVTASQPRPWKSSTVSQTQMVQPQSVTTSQSRQWKSSAVPQTQMVQPQSVTASESQRSCPSSVRGLLAQHKKPVTASQSPQKRVKLTIPMSSQHGLSQSVIASQLQHEPPKSCPLLELPAELLILIYQYVMSEQRFLRIGKANTFSNELFSKSANPAIMQTLCDFQKWSHESHSMSLQRTNHTANLQYYFNYKLDVLYLDFTHFSQLQSTCLLSTIQHGISSRELSQLEHLAINYCRGWNNDTAEKFAENLDIVPKLTELIIFVHAPGEYDPVLTTVTDLVQDDSYLQSLIMGDSDTNLEMEIQQWWNVVQNTRQTRGQTSLITMKTKHVMANID